MENGESRMKKQFNNLEEEMESIRQHPAAQDLLDLLRKQNPARTEQLISELTVTSDNGEGNETAGF